MLFTNVHVDLHIILLCYSYFFKEMNNFSIMLSTVDGGNILQLRVYSYFEKNNYDRNITVH